MSQSDAAPLPESGKPKLLDQVRHRCRLRHLALSTEHTYVGWIRRFILFHHKRHPLEMGANEVTAFLSHLAVAGHVAAPPPRPFLPAESGPRRNPQAGDQKARGLPHVSPLIRHAPSGRWRGHPNGPGTPGP